MKRPMVIFETGGDSFVKIVLNPVQAKRLAYALHKASEKVDKTKENVWVGMTRLAEEQVDITKAPEGPGSQEV
jgi:hypothetical protein